MIDDQKLVYETALNLSEEAAIGTKNVLIVEGGPGTGKSVVAINLLVELTSRGLVAKYVTKNAAPELSTSKSSLEHLPGAALAIFYRFRGVS